jgi:hypothetical protein
MTMQHISKMALSLFLPYEKMGIASVFIFFDCYVDFVLKYIEKLSMKVERVIEKED